MQAVRAPPFHLGMESKGFEKSVNNSVVSNRFARNPSMIRHLVRLFNVCCDFFWKQFDFYVKFSRFRIGYDCEEGHYKPYQLQQ